MVQNHVTSKAQKFDITCPNLKFGLMPLAALVVFRRNKCWIVHHLVFQVLYISWTLRKSRKRSLYNFSRHVKLYTNSVFSYCCSQCILTGELWVIQSFLIKSLYFRWSSSAGGFLYIYFFHLIGLCSSNKQLIGWFHKTKQKKCCSQQGSKTWPVLFPSASLSCWVAWPPSSVSSTFSTSSPASQFLSFLQVRTQSCIKSSGLLELNIKVLETVKSHELSALKYYMPPPSPHNIS